MGEVRPAIEPELKRPLWVIGANDYNLGTTVADVADEEMFYKFISRTDTDVDVCAQGPLDKHLRKLREESPETGIDIAYCAGINLLDAIADVDELGLYQTFNVNVMGFIRTLQAVAKVYSDFIDDEDRPPTPQTTCNVVVVASDAARTPMRRSINYCASKAAVVQAMRVGARELAPHVRVNAVSPGIIDGTPMTTSIDAEVMLQRNWSRYQLDEKELAAIPMQRRGTKWEIADMILLALNGPAYLTGSNIEITGGK
jgi:Dehydrogenases with different specificities (related to short-chain alcohol dehydrogenases)